MSNAPEPRPTVPLARLELRQERDVIACRAVTRAAAAAVGLALIEQARVATAVSETAAKVLEVSRDCEVALDLEISMGFRVEITSKAWKDSAPEAGTLITPAARLLTRAELVKAPGGGNHILLVQKLPLSVNLTEERARRIAEEIRVAGEPDLVKELLHQNQELAGALHELHARRSDLEKINEELGETNRGVVALYDELDTVYRVGRVVAAKLDLDSLLDAIVNATTEVSGAEIGAIFYQPQNQSNFVCRKLSGPLANQLEVREVDSLEELTFGQPLSEVWHLPDLAEQNLPSPLGASLPVRSYLGIVILNSEGEATGAMVYGHRRPGVFTERTERILGSVATQVSVGLENARLYSSVQAANEAKDHFLAILSHELRTPLSPVFTILAALGERADLPEDLKGDLDIMRRNLQLEARLIDDLLDLTRIVNGKVPFQWEVVDVHDLIRAAVGISRPEIERKQLRLDLELAAGHHVVSGDGARLQQVLWNLLSNAVKFSREGGSIQVSTAEIGETLSVTFRDHGYGIEAAALEKIFEPFVQADPRVSRLYGGLGLGLAISRSIIESHGGTIEAASAGPGQGASFTVTLNLNRQPAAARSAPAAPAEPHRPDSLRILLVDDHDDTRIMYSRILKNRGYEVQAAPNCATARELAGELEFDLLVSDLGLPDGSGHDLIRDLQAIRPLKGIALSGYGMESDLERSRNAGFAVHLTKPVELPALLEAIRAAMAEG
jgi:signal transduction histidine kinase/CheY-like chemotaxis protein